MKLHTITFILVLIGGLNWGLTALNYNLVEKLLGSWPMVVTIIYGLVGLSAVYEIVCHKSICKNCNTTGQSM
jgi:uncharacterized membrane protein YuzA (DUF378 family)